MIRPNGARREEPEPITEFQDRGFCVVDSLLTTRDVGTLADEYDRAIANHLSTDRLQVNEDGCVELLWLREPPAPLGESRVLSRLLDRSSEVAAQLLGFEPGRVSVAARFFFKPADGCGIPWHQDSAYVSEDVRARLNLWVPLDSVHADNGCLRFLPGTHREGAVPHELYQPDPETWYVPDVDESRAVELPLDPGDVSAHDWNVIHSSTPNRTDEPRRSLAIVCHVPG